MTRWTISNIKAKICYTLWSDILKVREILISLDDLKNFHVNITFVLWFCSLSIEKVHSKASHYMQHPKEDHIYCTGSLHCVVKYASPYVHIITCVSDSRRGFGLEIRCIVHFNSRLVTTLNYSSIVNLHTVLELTLYLSQSAVSSLEIAW
jgi:hypothetical protein